MTRLQEIEKQIRELKREKKKILKAEKVSKEKHPDLLIIISFGKGRKNG